MQFRELTDRYQLQKILKSTRFGTILRATDNRTGATVAVKLITVPPQPGVQPGAALMAAAPAFQKLAVTLAGLQHPNLPVVLDFGFTTDGSAFLVQEPLEGRTLDTLTGASPNQMLSLVAQALDGLETLASRGLTHHNVSPDNVLVLPNGQVKLTGLGAAIFRPRGPEAAGTENARYRAPELNEAGPADWRADIYSLALVACAAIGATVGFGDPPVVQLPLAVSFELENDEALRQALERSLRRNPGERPTPPQFREALRLALGGAATAPPPGQEPAAPAPLQAAPLPPPMLTPPDPAPSNVTPFPAPALPKPAAVPPAVPVTAAAAAPLTEEEQEEEVLSAVDDEILNALLSVPAPPPRLPSSAEAQGNVVPFPSGPVPVASAPRTAAKKPRAHRRPAVLAVIAGVLVLGALTAYWFLSRPKTAAETVAAPPPPALPDWFQDPPVEELEQARMYLALGEDLKARKVLRAIPYGQQGLLSPEACRTLSSIEENLALAGLERLPSDLAAALRDGDFAALQGAIDVGTGQEAGMTPEVRADFDRARALVQTYAEAMLASGRGEHVAVLERLAALKSQLPELSDPEDLRGKAASALEAQAEALTREASYDKALTVIEPIGRTWPDRPGHEERVAKYQKYKEDEKAQEAILATLPTAERRKTPEEGLQMLEGVEPTPHLAPRFAEARARLEELLARLDKEPPKVVLRDGYLLEYARGTVAELSFRATDDHKVKDVKILARPEGGKWKELPAEKSRSFYFTVEIGPDFHKNGTVEVYAVATDLSGHEGMLGSRDQPLVVKRKQGFERLIR